LAGKGSSLNSSTQYWSSGENSNQKCLPKIL